MRVCPTCEREYLDGVEICAEDGTRLVPTTRPSTTSGVTTVVIPAAGEGTRFEAGAVPMWASASASASASAPATSASALSSMAPSPASTAAASPATASAVAVEETSDPASAGEEAFDSLVGATLAGRYLIIRRIGEGGMGAVYEAKHTVIGKRVAVKVLLEKFLTKSDFVARLLQEARLASAIGHEHIVDVTDFGTTDDGRAFVAMEFLDGESLAQLVMREAPLPVERSLRITRQVASALGAAHAKGIVHRDVKPENVYLIKRGDVDFVKVVDFGISKAVKQGQGDDAPDYRLTHTGLLLGTPLYMSPEQARGDEDLDERVDVWAMGVMMYECLTGEVPFRANNYLGIISQVLTHTPRPPSRLRPELGIPEAVEAVVMHAMEKDRNLRYARMSDVEQDLDRLLAGDQNVGAGVIARPATVPPPTGPARGRLWVWSAAVAALISGVAMVLTRPEGTSPIAAPLDPRAGTGAAAATISPSRTAEPTGRATPSTTSGPAIAPGGAADESRSPDPAARPRGDGSETRAADLPVPVDEAAADDLSSRTRRPGRAHQRPSSRRGFGGRNQDDGENMLPPGARLPTHPANPVIRGVLPSRSGEGYPDN